MLTGLHPREVFLRLSSEGKLLPCVKARTLDITPAPKVANVKLKEYTEATQMPSKFVENAQNDADKLKQVMPSQPTQVSQNVPVASVTTAQSNASVAQPSSQVRPGAREYINLQDILASNSSSRDKVRKAKK